MYQIESTLLSDKLFQNTIEIIVETRGNITGKNSNLADAVLLYMTTILNDLEKNESNVNPTHTCLRINMLTVFHFYMFGNADKKYMKHLLEFNKKVIRYLLNTFFLKQFLSTNH